MSQHDQIQRYLFENYAVRGELVNVSDTWRKIITGHDYPQSIQQLLGELLVATTLLTATLKFEGDITVQLQGDGPITLAVINGNHRQEMRGLARVQGEITTNSTLAQMIGNGHLVITLAPKQGKQYQGIVDLEGDSLAACLENYFLRSEQLLTRLFLHTSDAEGQWGAGGILLQVLPTDTINNDNFCHLTALTETIKTAELITLPANEVLWRLYHQEEVTLYDPQRVTFKCRCSRTRCSDVLTTLSPSEIDDILAEKGEIDMHCDYCGNHYLFHANEIASLHEGLSSGHQPLH